MRCIPPWLSPNNQCFKNFTDQKSLKYINGIFLEQFITPPNNWNPTAAENDCKYPCKIMTNQVSLVGERYKCAFCDTELVFKFENLVRVEKKVVVYTIFEFIIYGGSSLGLWLGLSALSITDLALQAIVSIRKLVPK